MELEKPPLFLDLKEFLVFTVLFLIIIAFRLAFYYVEYREFVTKPFYYTYANVLDEYPKESQSNYYKILKLQTDEDLTLFLAAGDYDFKDKRVRIQIFPDSTVTFMDYLRGFYVQGFIKKRFDASPNPILKTLLQAIQKQHNHPDIVQFYHAIYFATPLTKAFRNKVAVLGISHHIALSGFHLSILSTVLFFLLRLLYHPLQKRYFPYRNAFIDIGFVVLIFLGLYTLFVGVPPSLLRSYAMLTTGWLALLLGFRLFSFEFLGFTTLVLIALFPKLLVSLALWLSIGGVFYIFLVQHYTQTIQNKILLLLLFSVLVYLFMLPITHLFFDTTSPYQLTSPLTNIFFSFFYPFSIFLHLVGYGGLLDGWLLSFFDLGTQDSYAMMLNWESFLLYTLLSFVAIRSQLGFYLLVAISILYALSLYIPL